VQVGRKSSVVRLTLPTRRTPRPEALTLAVRYPSTLWSPAFPRLPPLSSLQRLDGPANFDWINPLVGGIMFGMLTPEAAQTRGGAVGSRPVLIEFKDSLHTLLCHAMDKGRLPPGQLPTALFGLAAPSAHKTAGNVQALIRINALRLAPSEASIVLDCSACVLTHDHVQDIVPSISHLTVINVKVSRHGGWGSFGHVILHNGPSRACPFGRTGLGALTAVLWVPVR
jgi:hypothetical protein